MPGELREEGGGSTVKTVYVKCQDHEVKGPCASTKGTLLGFQKVVKVFLRTSLKVSRTVTTWKSKPIED